MYKVVIVDDEPLIVEGLKKIVDWDRYDCVVAGTASSGKDGLTMIAALRSEHKDLQVVILTGYRDFEYARQALTLGVHRFLVKPSRMKELNEAMESLVQKLGGIKGERSPAEGDEENANIPGCPPMNTEIVF